MRTVSLKNKGKDRKMDEERIEQSMSVEQMQ